MQPPKIQSELGISNVRVVSPELLTIEEVAEMLRCSVRHVTNLKRRGYLRFLRHGGKMVRFHRKSVEQYIERWSTRETLAG